MQINSETLSLPKGTTDCTAFKEGQGLLASGQDAVTRTPSDGQHTWSTERRDGSQATCSVPGRRPPPRLEGTQACGLRPPALSAPNPQQGTSRVGRGRSQTVSDSLPTGLQNKVSGALGYFFIIGSLFKNYIWFRF